MIGPTPKGERWAAIDGTRRLEGQDFGRKMPKQLAEYIFLRPYRRHGSHRKHTVSLFSNFGRTFLQFFHWCFKIHLQLCS